MARTAIAAELICGDDKGAKSANQLGDVCFNGARECPELWRGVSFQELLHKWKESKRIDAEHVDGGTKARQLGVAIVTARHTFDGGRVTARARSLQTAIAGSALARVGQRGEAPAQQLDVVHHVTPAPE